MAARAVGSPAEVASLGAEAGTDLLLFTRLRSARAAHEELVASLAIEELGREEAEASAERVLELREALGSESLRD